MLDDNNFLELLFTFIPALVYSIIIYLIAPTHCWIKWKTASFFFTMGLVSTIIVNAFHYAFPRWNEHLKEISLYLSLLIYSMKVGLIEEVSKFSMFKITEWYRNKQQPIHPAAIMFYAMSVSCGFAVSENILYAQTFGGDVLFIRSFTSVIVHMTCGLYLGYFVALGRLVNERVKKNVIPRNAMYAIFSIAIASVYHGIYDFNIFCGINAANNSAIIVSIGILCGVAMYKSLFKHDSR